MSTARLEWLCEREYSLRASTLADDSCCNRSRFFQSRIRSRLVDPKRLSIVYSRTQKTQAHSRTNEKIHASRHDHGSIRTQVEDFASNGSNQTENPDMAPFAAALQ
jgi:hypothetical protein